MADMLNKEMILLIDRKIHQLKIIDTLSVPSIVMDVQLPYFALEMENWLGSPHSKTFSLLDPIFELYHKLAQLDRLYTTYSLKNKKSTLEIESWFLPYIKRWLNMMNESILEWVMNAIEEDNFQCINKTASYSSSVDDFFVILDRSVEFIIDLQWPNYLQYCLFQTRLSKVISEAIERFCKAIEILIKKDLELDMHTNLEELKLPGDSIFDIAKYQLLGIKGPQKDDCCIPASIRPEICVKLNDIEAVRCKLDKLYQFMHGEQLVEYMRAHMNGANQATSGESCYSYSIEILRAQKLPPLKRSGTSDSYVVLEVSGKPIFKTRTVHRTLNPRWNQELHVQSKERSLDVLAIVYSEDMVGADEECGSVWFKLSQELFGDCQTHEVQLPLSPQGSIDLRICMNGEKNDIQFWFGRSFRILRRTENDVAEHVVSKMMPYISHCLSREVINFLEENLNILYSNLSEAIMRLVIMKIWKDILMILDEMLLPPLSEQVSDMVPLDIYELDIVFKWIELLKILFNGGEDGDAISLEELECSEYYCLLSLNTVYHSSTDHLIHLCQTAQKSNSAVSIKTNVQKQKQRTNRSKSVYYSKNTVNSKPKDKDRVTLGVDMLPIEYILRLLRMRREKSAIEFLHSEYEQRNNNSLYQSKTVVVL
ncbi:hypothetical protein G6F35_006694 [Rhizopus arrhizus]|nr:hypothetical protein G6F35_006694 [Rhizopus arrhizus]